MGNCILEDSLWYCLLIHNPVAVVALLSAIIAYLGYQNQIKHTRQKNSIDFEASYKSNKIISRAFRRFREINKADLPDLGRKNEPTCDHQAIVTVLNEWERAANAIRHKIYDEDYLFQIYGTTVTSLYNFLHPFIKERQNENPRLYVNFQLLALDWLIRRKREGREKFENTLRSNQEHIDLYRNTEESVDKAIHLHNASESLKKTIGIMYK